MSNYEANSKGLFKDGKPITPEYGNEEQIKAIRKYEKRAEELNGEGLALEPEWEVTVRFECLCGAGMSEQKEDIGDMDLSNFEGNTVECGRCNKEYEFFIDDFNDLKVMAVKL